MCQKCLVWSDVFRLSDIQTICLYVSILYRILYFRINSLPSVYTLAAHMLSYYLRVQLNYSVLVIERENRLPLT